MPRLKTTALCLALFGCAPSGYDAAQVRPGIDVLLSDSSHLVSGRRVGLVTNQTGVDSRGVSDPEVLLNAGVELTAIFSPEHGFRGLSDDANIEHSVDSATGLPIFSLYGERLAPSDEMLSLVDVMLIDLQDIGARTYTYISSALHVMEAAGDSEVPVVILDRPNPIGGRLVQGPILEPKHASYVGMLPVPLRHGMTMGELALFGNDALALAANLSVVPVAGWRRHEWFDDTGLPWIKPSPNMPNLESATHYPGFVLFEASNLSVGRGTPIAFQVLGAPWLDPESIIDDLGAEPGVQLSDTSFTPKSPSDGKYPDETLPALRFRVTDRMKYDPVRMAIRVLAALREIHLDSMRLRSGLERLAGTDSVRSWFESGDPWYSLYHSWEPDLARFRRASERYLLYQ